MSFWNSLKNLFKKPVECDDIKVARCYTYPLLNDTKKIIEKKKFKKLKKPFSFFKFRSNSVFIPHLGHISR